MARKIEILLIDGVEHKKCSKCGEVKPLTEYHIRKTYPDGRIARRGECKVCKNEIDRVHKKKPEVKARLKATNARWYNNNKAHKKEQVSIYRKTPEGKDTVSRYNKKYNDNPDNKQKRKEYNSWYHNQPENKERINFNKATQRAIRHGAKYTPDMDVWFAKTLELLGDRCPYCGVKFTKDNYHNDHIVPLARGGSHTPDNMIRCCSSCNTSKGARDMEEWYRSKSFFSEERLQHINAIIDYWKSQDFEVLMPTQDQIKAAHEVAEDALATLQSMSRLQRDPDYIQEYI